MNVQQELEDFKRAYPDYDKTIVSAYYSRLFILSPRRRSQDRNYLQNALTKMQYPKTKKNEKLNNKDRAPFGWPVSFTDFKYKDVATLKTFTRRI